MLTLCAKTTATICALTLFTATPAYALSTDWVDAIIGTSAVVASGLLFLIPMDTTSRWDSELIPGEEVLHDTYSDSAANSSDVLVITTLLLPPAFAAGRGIDERFGRYMLHYGQSLAIGLVLNTAVKRLVGRPRPYVYNDHLRVKAYADGKGDDSRQSFYSGHAALAFGGAVAGSYLYALNSDDIPARSTLWGTELLMASMTAILRVRAGRHFYSDIAVGALMGIAVGVAVPALHEGGTDYRPHLAEWISAGAGLIAGTTLGLVLPFDQDITESIAIAPLTLEDGSGVSLVGTF